MASVAEPHVSTTWVSHARWPRELSSVSRKRPGFPIHARKMQYSTTIQHHRQLPRGTVSHYWKSESCVNVFQKSSLPLAVPQERLVVWVVIAMLVTIKQMADLLCVTCVFVFLSTTCAYLYAAGRMHLGTLPIPSMFKRLCFLWRTMYVYLHL